QRVGDSYYRIIFNIHLSFLLMGSMSDTPKKKAGSLTRLKLTTSMNVPSVGGIPGICQGQG
ncbi:MAG: hypothetical protein R6U25_02640, partial [Alkalispirochaeta sp.]